jgi:hypothetical protein
MVPTQRALQWFRIGELKIAHHMQQVEKILGFRVKVGKTLPLFRSRQ